MSIRFHYGTSVTVLPALPPDVLTRATAADLRVLLCLAPYAQASALPLPAYDALAETVGLPESQLHASMAFWRGAGVLQVEEGSEHKSGALPKQLKQASPPPAQSKDAVAAEAEPITPEIGETTAKSTVAQPRVTVRKPSRKNELPNYSAEEMTKLLESSTTIADGIHECEQIWGKLFNTHETNIILGLVDYLGLEWDYVITLLAHCASTLKRQGSSKSLHYVEQTAFAYYDEGVNNMTALQERIRRAEMLSESEGQLRTLFGMGARSLTPNEKKCFSAWLYEFQFDMTIIRLAYDITVDTKGEANIKYMNSILANWNRDSLRTPEAIEASMAAFRAKNEQRGAKGGKVSRTSKLPEPLPGGSFETDDFFDTAVSKTFADTPD